MGGFSTAVRTVTGQWYSFGRNDMAQLGLGHGSITTYALPIPDINGSQVVDVLMGSQYTFLKNAAGVWYAVGYNEPGCLGIGYVSAWGVIPTPILVPASVTVAKMVVSYFTAGLMATDGSVYLWGDNTFGQVGINSTKTPFTTPQRVPITNATILALGIYNSYTVTVDGKYYAWGQNRNGQLGTGDLVQQLAPTRVVPPDGLAVTRVVSGYLTVAFLTANGTWYMVGQNQYGQLGNVSLGPSVATPVPFPLLGGYRVVRMSAGQYHWAGLTEAGSWYIWGYNYDGELGLGITSDVNGPQLLALGRGETIQEVTLGLLHSAALRSATYTPTVTQTPTVVQCPGSKQFAADTLAVTLNSPCRSVYRGPGTPASGNVGSDSIFDRFVMVYIRAVQAGYALDVDLLAGCPPAPAACGATFAAGTAELTAYLPVASTPQVLLALSLHPASGGNAAATVQRSADLGASHVELAMAYQGSSLLLGVTCSLTALAMLLLCGGLWWRYWVRRTRQRSESRTPRRALSKELAEALCSVLLAFGAWCLTVGVLWLIIGLLSTKPLSLAPALFITGCCLAGIGAVLIAGCGMYLLLDPVAVKCPECDEPVSRWKFRGTYIQVSGCDSGAAPFSKAHTRHVRCQLCKRPVVQDRWPASAPCRPYHRDCWETFCSKAVMDRQYFNTWWDSSRHQASRVELVHMLAMAITTREFEAVDHLAELDPKLIFTPIFSSGMRTPVQLAALFGHRDMLEMLLQRGQPRTLDAACVVDPQAPKSMRIYGLDKEDNDLYLYQPQVLYNDQPVFVGHTNGKYIYYYDPCPEPGDRQYAAGWCLSPHLGSGRGKVRLKLDEAISAEVAPKSSHGKLSEAAYTSLLHRVKSWLTMKSTKRAPAKGPHPLLSAGDSSSSLSGHPLMATVVPTVERKLIDVQVDWVPHATSLLLDAITSGNQATIQFVLHLYHRQDHSCLKWQYRTQEGLWETYPPAEQRDLAAAAALGLPEVNLGTEEDPRTLRFEDRHEVCGAQRRPVRSTMRAIVQFTRKGLTVSSNVDSVWEWDGSCIVFAPSHAAAAAPDEETLAFLVEEGVVDHALWSPPCHVGPAWQTLSEDYSPVLNHFMAEELRVALGDVSVQPTTLSNLFRSIYASARNMHRAENRLTDGLDVAPQSDAHLAFYVPTYTSTTWALPFCVSLPKHGQDFIFQEELLLQMALDALKKGHELQRQGSPHPLRHSLALFVYTYEMVTTEPTDQIYSCMNRAMRLRDANQIAFWRPLIWEIDQALQALPPAPSRSFRGINCQMDPNLYRAGRHICWPSFSSASQSRSVAEEFAKGESGTLFFLQGTTPRHIACFSHYPDEDEVLFGPNTVFEITTTLQQTSDIGQFYGKVDNI
eukprot:EG_transcript_529